MLAVEEESSHNTEKDKPKNCWKRDVEILSLRGFCGLLAVVFAGFVGYSESWTCVGLWFVGERVQWGEDEGNVIRGEAFEPILIDRP